MEQKVAIVMELNEVEIGKLPSSIKRFYFVRRYEDEIGFEVFNPETKYRLKSYEFEISNFHLKIRSCTDRSKYDDMDLNISMDDLSLLQLDKQAFNHFIFEYLRLMYGHQKKLYETPNRKTVDQIRREEVDDNPEDASSEVDESIVSVASRESFKSKDKFAGVLLSEEEFLFKSEESISFFKQLFNVENFDDMDFVALKNELISSLETTLKRNKEIISTTFLFTNLFFPTFNEKEKTRFNLIESFGLIVRSTSTSFQFIKDDNLFNKNVIAIIGKINLSSGNINPVITHINTMFKKTGDDVIKPVITYKVKKELNTDLDHLLNMLLFIMKIIYEIYNEISLLLTDPITSYNVKSFFHFENEMFNPILQMTDRVLFYINNNKVQYEGLKNKDPLYVLRESIKALEHAIL